MLGQRMRSLFQFIQVFPVCTSILLIQTVVFLMIRFADNASDPTVWVQYGGYVTWRINEGEWWRLVSAVFVNTGYLQLIFGYVLIYIFGPQMEWLLGRFYFLSFFLITGCFVYFGIYIFQLPGVYSGFDGAVYGCLGFHIFLYLHLLNDRETGYGLLIISLICVLLDWKLAHFYLFSLLFGYLLTNIMLHLRRLQAKKNENDEDK